MAYVEMIPWPRNESRGFFGCQWATWDLMLELGQQYGWKPLGTMPDPSHLCDWDGKGGFQTSYESEDFPLVKRVTESDALAWAQALERCAEAMGDGITTVKGNGTRVISERYPLEANCHLMYGVKAPFIRRFATFLRGGGFTFLWEDSGGPIAPNPDQAPYSDLFDLGMSAFAAGKFKAAEEALLGVTKAVPNLVVVWLNLGLVYRSLGDHEKAVRAHLEATKVAPEEWDAHQALGNSLREAKCFTEAVMVLRKAVQLAPDRASCWSSLGSALSKTGAFEEATEAHHRAMALQPEDPRWASNHAVNLRAQGDISVAIEFLKPWAERFPSMEVLQENLGTYYMDAKRFEEALPCMVKASQLNPSNPDYLHRQVICHLELHNSVQAKEVLIQHLALAPEVLPGWNLLLQLDPTEEEREEAQRRLRAAEQGNQKGPESPEAPKAPGINVKEQPLPKPKGTGSLLEKVKPSEVSKERPFHMSVNAEMDCFFDDSSLSSNGEPHFVLLVGAVAVGKTTLRKERYSTGYVLVDAVPIFLRLCQGDYLPFPDWMESPMNIIGRLVAQKAIEEQRNIVTELMGDDSEQLKELIDAMVAIGYNVDVIHVHCPFEDAVRRNLNRDDDCVSAFYAQKYQREWLMTAASKKLMIEGDQPQM